MVDVACATALASNSYGVAAQQSQPVGTCQTWLVSMVGVARARNDHARHPQPRRCRCGRAKLQSSARYGRWGGEVWSARQSRSPYAASTPLLRPSRTVIARPWLSVPRQPAGPAVQAHVSAKAASPLD